MYRHLGEPAGTPDTKGGDTESSRHASYMLVQHHVSVVLGCGLVVLLVGLVFFGEPNPLLVVSTFSASALAYWIGRSS